MYFCKYVCILCVLVSIVTLKAQSLSEAYQKSIIQLNEVKDYGLKNDWEQIFYDYTKVSGRSQIGKMKQFIIASDGSVFISDKSTYTIAKFDKDGNFLKRFGQKGSKNKDFLYAPEVDGVIDNKYLITHDSQGRIQLFTLNGDFVRLVKLDYIPTRIVPLKDSYVAILGFVVMSRRRIKDFISIKNLETGVEKIIWQKVETSRVMLNTSSNSFYEPSLYISSRYFMPLIGCNKKGELIIVFPETGEVARHSKEGRFLTKFKTNMETILITDEDLKNNIVNAKQNLELFLKKQVNMSPEEKERIIKEFDIKLKDSVDKGLYTKSLPYCSAFIMDSDDNLLLFEYTKEKDNQFNVYTLSQEGKSIATASFQSNNYTLSYIPGKFAFHNSFVYALGMLKEDGGKVPLRLVKFEIKK